MLVGVPGGNSSGESGGSIHLDFRPPGPVLAPYVHTFYLFRTEAALEGVERVGLGNIRFVLRGEGSARFASGREAASRPVSITAPPAAAIAYRLKGPFVCFGVSLRPLGWSALTGLNARASAERIVDGATLYGQDALALRTQLQAMETIEAMAIATEAFLLRHLRAVPATHHRLARAVREWELSPDPTIESLYARVDMSPRQVARLLNQYYGGPPKLLERKVRATRAAIALVRGVDPNEVAGMFYDQAHMIRELRQFLGHTPRSLRERADPVLEMMLLREPLPQAD